jgi:hypothetical protein
MAQGLTEPVADAAVTLAEPVIVKGEKAVKRRVTKAARKTRSKLSKALKQINKKAKLKSGKLRKGWSQSKIMREAHKLARRL